MSGPWILQIECFIHCVFISNIYKLVSGSVYFHHINVFLASAALNSLTTSFYGSSLFLASVTHGSVFLQGFVFGFLVA